MKHLFKSTLLLLILFLTLDACKDDDMPDDPVDETLDRFLTVTNITSSANVTAYIGTFRDLDVEEFTNERSHQTTPYPFVSVHGDDAFLCENRSGDRVLKYTRRPNGELAQTGSLTMPGSSQPMHVVVANDTRAYCSLYNTGSIAVFDPTSMSMIEFIDLTAYAKGDASPDPGVMTLYDGKLYVACSQTTDTYTSSHPAEVIIIDLENGNALTSAIDDRSGYAGNVEDPGSIFVDEMGDVYVYCVSSYGFVPGQKAGFLRIRQGETTFDPDYFFNTTDLVIAGVENGYVDYLYHPQYTSDGIIYSTGNVPALASNPPDYINDHTFGAFKVNIYDQSIELLDIPFSNGFSASVLAVDNIVLFGMSSSTGVGFFEYDPMTGAVSTSPLVNTQGDPSVILEFD